MIKQSRNLLWLLPLLFFLTSPLWRPPLASFLQPRGSEEEKAVPTLQSRRFVMDSLVITMSSSGYIEWVINAKQAFTGRTDQEIGMSGVDAVYTDRKQNLTVITSDRGVYRVNDRHLILLDNVLVRKPVLQQEMRTELLHYYDETKMVVSPVDVEITAPTFNIQAGRMDYDLANDAYDLSKRVLCKF